MTKILETNLPVETDDNYWKEVDEPQNGDTYIGMRMNSEYVSELERRARIQKSLFDLKIKDAAIKLVFICIILAMILFCIDTALIYFEKQSSEIISSVSDLLKYIISACLGFLFARGGSEA